MRGKTNKHGLGVGQARFIQRFHRGRIFAKPAAHRLPLLEVFARLALPHGISRQPDGGISPFVRRSVAAEAQIIAQPRVYVARMTDIYCDAVRFQARRSGHGQHAIRLFRLAVGCAVVVPPPIEFEITQI